MNDNPKKQNSHWEFRSKKQEANKANAISEKSGQPKKEEKK